ncbi:carbohydrate-binding family 9-like protein [Mucilaginibacter sp. SP1R1]|uniref:carbohydrate-binding family 9-like protein n=1 Tax=Mucilaginibacter sp. SP1R1 TaxID=2723091 RepID=UPI001620D911|nr:carbohydrate-binding family 9-like protein [Mucilaginibacter sp. SP1R1]MBB6149085.1 hypothetical protein [Mucilaginibacter sp. SP1R1]
MIKEFKASFVSDVLMDFDIQEVSLWLNGQQKQTISNLLWSDKGYFPEVSFSMAYTQSHILLKYFVQEQYTRAFYKNINDPVYNDSCVEFFIAMAGDKNYYNLEFNSLGTALVGYGSGKHDRVDVPDDAIKKIKSYSTMQLPTTDAGSFATWELTLKIPFEVFIHHPISSLKDEQCWVNFYKCGDELPEPHFLSWNNIVNHEPNFHLPEFFGKVSFV